MELKDLNAHAYALWYAGLILQRNSQPVKILECDNRGFTLQLRTNLQNIQAERLIVKPMDSEIVGYSALADYKNKVLRVEMNAPKSRTKATPGSKGQSAD